MGACPEIQSTVSLDEAHGILLPFFEAAREIYLEKKGTARREALGLLSRVRDCEFFVAEDIHDSPRHFGACSETGKKIICAPELVMLTPDFVIGILAHEFGHAVDFLYPGEFALGPGGIVRRTRDDVSETQWLRWMRAWEARGADVVELTADGIAEAVWGKPIGYAGPCLLQNFRTGEARPQGLR